ncbi:MAG: hypothetical protein KC620_00790 [Myxococcales bacterium]|nr:hypothetical protein [Myxococcales bacterium]
MRAPLPRSLLPLTLLLALAGCRAEDEALTRDEAKEAVDEATLSTEVGALTQDVITVSTDFTLGDAVEQAAANLRDFAAAQIPCATVGLQAHTVTIDFGVRGESDCLWHGRRYTGRVEVQIEKVDAGVEVTHSWTDVSDGKYTVNGGATVTWDREARTRRVQHSLAWTDGEHEGQGEGDRTQQLLDSGDGLRVDGTRSWTGRAGRTWTLRIEGVELRAVDPLPQAGTYVLETPFDKTLTLSFERVDDRTIKVTASSGKRSFDFNVRSSLN